MKILFCKDIDIFKWEKSIIKNNNNITLSIDFLNFFCNNNWYAIIFGNYDKVLAFCKSKKFGIEYIYMPYMIQSFDSHHLTNEDISQVIEYLNNKYFYVNYSISHCIQNSFRYNFQEKTNLIIENLLSEEELRKGYTKKLKLRLKKQLLIIKKENVNDTVLSLFSQSKYYSQLFNYKKINDYYYNFQHKNIVSYNAYYNDILVASQVIYEFDNTIFFLLLHNDKHYNYLYPNSILIDNILRNNLHKNISFNGSNILSIKKFFSHFGPKEIKYYNYVKSNFIFNKFVEINFFINGKL